MHLDGLFCCTYYNWWLKKRLSLKVALFVKDLQSAIYVRHPTAALGVKVKTSGSTETNVRKGGQNHITLNNLS